MMFKRMFTSFLCCMLVAGGVVVSTTDVVSEPAFAEEAAVQDLSASAEEITNQDIIGGFAQAIFDNPQLLVIEQGADASTLVPPSDITFKIGSFTLLHNLSAEWYYDSIDTTVTGRQYLVGRVILPEKYYYLGESAWISLTIKQPVWVYAQDMTQTEQLTLAQSPFVDGFEGFPSVPWGSSEAELNEALAPCIAHELVLKTYDGLSLTCSAVIDYTLIDTSVAGIYYPYYIDTPAGLVPDVKNLGQYDFSVVVEEGDEGEVPGGDDDGDGDDGETPGGDDDGDDSGNSGGNNTDQSSGNTVTTLTQPTVRNTTAVIQSIITPEDEEAASEDADGTTNTQASESMTSIQVLGSELNALAASTDYVPFVTDNVKVQLPSEAVLELNLQDDDRFAVHMENVPSESVTVLMDLNDNPVSLSSSFNVSIPWESNDGSSWHDDAGATVSTYFDEVAKSLTLTFTTPGTVHRTEPTIITSLLDSAIPLSSGLSLMTLPVVTMVIAVMLVVAAGWVALSLQKRRRRNARASVSISQGFLRYP